MENQWKTNRKLMENEWKLMETFDVECDRYSMSFGFPGDFQGIYIRVRCERNFRVKHIVFCYRKIYMKTHHEINYLGRIKVGGECGWSVECDGLTTRL